MKRLLWVLVAGSLAALLIYAGSRSWGTVPPMGVLLDPADGLFHTARTATHPDEEVLTLDALEAPVEIYRDERGVPHIFAENDHDAVVAMGYVAAQDRLFQLDFIPRVARGGLSEFLGADMLQTDRFLRRTGMAWGAQQNWQAIQQEGGIELDLMEWYAAGVNAYLDALAPEDLPFEFRLLGYEPERYTPMHTALMLQYMAYDLTYHTDEAWYAKVRRQVTPEAYETLYPRDEKLFVPIIPTPGGGANPQAAPPPPPAPTGQARRMQQGAEALLAGQAALQARLGSSTLEGYREGKGSNNWAVAGARSTTGAPILAGDMHLLVSLPAIWYEVHLVTPEMNTYGVAVPGSPLPVAAFNDHVAWTFTNSATDQIDHYALELDEAKRRYRFGEGWRDLILVPDTLRLQGGGYVVDSLYYAHFGPVVVDDTSAVAIQWTAHKRSRTLAALWGMNHATDYASFEQATRHWDTPMQNILVADANTIAIRSTGFLPIRAAGHGAGLLDGTSDAFAWTGRVPFDELPHAVNPTQAYLTSTNQQPADASYPYYQGHDWRSHFRSIRANELLRAKPQHSVEDLKRYHADVRAVQRDFVVPMLDSLAGLSARADSLRTLLSRWDGTTSVDRPEPLAFDYFLRILQRMAWDETVFAQKDVNPPHIARLFVMLRDDPQASWLDVRTTDAIEDGPALLKLALEAATDTLAQNHGWNYSDWRWGDHHKIVFNHVLPPLKALGRGPMEYPGFSETLSPARKRHTTHSASWRMVVDFSQQPPKGFGIYPGGQSGNPFSPQYDAHLEDFVAFRHYELHKPASPAEAQRLFDGPVLRFNDNE